VRITKVVVFFTTNPKNWFCNFLNFLRFSRNFTSFCQLCLLLKNHSYDQTPRTFQSLTHIPLDRTKLPRKTWGLAMPPLAVGQRGSGQFRRAGGAPGLASGRARLGAHLGRRGGRGSRGGSPTRACGGGRRERPRRPGVTARRMFCWATRDPGGAIDPRECARELGW
jgi:hypothetical protein